MRQRRDKTRPPPADDNDHAGIPRDVEGNPIFLILPPELRAEYEEQMVACKAAWEEDGEPLAIAEATTWTRIYRQPIAHWLEAAVVKLAVSCSTQTHANRRLAARKRWLRYECVRNLKIRLPGISEPKAKMHGRRHRAV
jgi:hypothetical protein